MNKLNIQRYLVKQGYNEDLVIQLNSKELYRIFILTLAFNSTIAL